MWRIFLRGTCTNTHLCVQPIGHKYNGGNSLKVAYPCADPGIFVRGLDNVFFSPQLILQFTEGVQWFYFRESYTFPRIQRGSNIFQGRESNFSQRVQLLIFIETHITCDFPGGPVPLSPLWVLKCCWPLIAYVTTIFIYIYAPIPHRLRIPRTMKYR